MNVRWPVLVLAGVMTMLPAQSRAQEKDQLFTATKQQLDVTKVILRQEDAWNRGDLSGFLAYFKDDPETVAILAGPVRGLGNIRAAYKTNFPSADAMGKLEQSEVEVRALGTDFALATGKYRLLRSRKAGGETQGSFTEIFEKTPNGWLMVYSAT